MTPRILLALIAFLGVTTHPRIGHAERRRIVAILEVSVEGVPTDIAAQFQTSLEKQLDSQAYWLAPKSRVDQLMETSTKWTPGCLVGPCLREVRVQTGAELVLIAAITGSGTSFGHVVTVMRTDTGRYLSQDTSRCDVCTVKEALASATEAAVKLLTAVPETLPDEEGAARAALQQTETKRVTAHRATRRRHKRIAIATTLTGLAVAGAGAAVYFLRDRSNVGLATAAAGGGLTLGGVIALSF